MEEERGGGGGGREKREGGEKGGGGGNRRRERRIDSCEGENWRENFFMYSCSSRSNNEEDGPPAHSTVEEVMEEKELTPTTVRYRYPLFIRDISRSIPEPIKSSLK